MQQHGATSSGSMYTPSDHAQEGNGTPQLKHGHGQYILSSNPQATSAPGAFVAAPVVPAAAVMRPPRSPPPSPKDSLTAGLAELMDTDLADFGLDTVNRDDEMSVDLGEVLNSCMNLSPDHSPPQRKQQQYDPQNPPMVYMPASCIAFPAVPKFMNVGGFNAKIRPQNRYAGRTRTLLRAEQPYQASNFRSKSLWAGGACVPI